MILETKRLILRPWTLDDVESLYEYAKDPDVGPIAGWPPHKNVDESRSVIENVFNGKQCYAICLKSDGKAIGAIELKLNGHTDMTERDDECELGYWLGKPFWGNGYMPEAARELIRFGFENLNMAKIWCGYYEGNEKSKRVQEKCGFTYYRTTNHVEVPLMNEVRVGHTNVLTKEQWLLNPHDSETVQEWKVTFSGDFGTRERAGKEVSVEKCFTWADREWYIPSVYVCSKGLVVDFCMKVESEKIQAFMDRWNLSPENEEEILFTREEEMLLELENPLCFHFHSKAIVNGKVLMNSHGRGTSYNPCLPKEYASDYDSEAVRIAEHYGLDLSVGWMFWRSYFPWNTKRKPNIKTLELEMMQQKAEVPGIHFRVNKPGDKISFTYPEGGQQYTLTVQEYEKQEMNMEHVFHQDWEFPTYYHQMVYSIEPEMERGVMTVVDCAEGDRPKMKQQEPFGPTAVSSIGIIGGADGPTSIFIGAAVRTAACSSLHFEPVEDVEWRMVFREKKYEDGVFELIL